jgi:hypothetical protein
MTLLPFADEISISVWVINVVAPVTVKLLALVKSAPSGPNVTTAIFFFCPLMVTHGA